MRSFVSLFIFIIVFCHEVTINLSFVFPRSTGTKCVTSHIKPTMTIDSFLSASNSVDISNILYRASMKAVDGGIAGASASAVQVLSLMWLRTAMNYQYQYGNTTLNVLKMLYSEGGIPRLYQGVSFALVQGPLSRFGDTAANSLIIELLRDTILPIPVKTLFGSLAAGTWRILLMPIDTAKTSLQVNGKTGFDNLKTKISERGLPVLYSGSVASGAATAVGHYPWFTTYNILSANLPTAAMLLSSIPSPDGSSDSYIEFLRSADPLLLDLIRSAFIGLCASSISDVCSNSLRVLKTAKQTAADDRSYVVIAKEIIAVDGLLGLLGRGLQTRVLSNMIQGTFFSVMWKYFQNVYSST